MRNYLSPHSIPKGKNLKSKSQVPNSQRRQNHSNSNPRLSLQLSQNPGSNPKIPQRNGNEVLLEDVLYQNDRYWTAFETCYCWGAGLEFGGLGSWILFFGGVNIAFISLTLLDKLCWILWVNLLSFFLDFGHLLTFLRLRGVVPF